MSINRSILAGIRGCKNGSVCLGNCPDCTIQKTPLMIQTAVFKAQTIEPSSIGGIFTNKFDVSDVSLDSYINKIAEM
jgi:hypothetical protein